jgi:hypothetical protein
MKLVSYHKRTIQPAFGAILTPDGPARAVRVPGLQLKHLLDFGTPEFKELG